MLSEPMAKLIVITTIVTTNCLRHWKAINGGSYEITVVCPSVCQSGWSFP